MEYPIRKPTRLPRFDYSTGGAYFITICTNQEQMLLSHIVGGGVLDAPQSNLSKIGRAVEMHLRNSRQVNGVHVDKYVIMPNHIHFILLIDTQDLPPAASPANQKVPRFVSGFKRLCNQSVGIQLFQRSYHDHVIRNQQDYLRIWKYMDTNPAC